MCLIIKIIFSVLLTILTMEMDYEEKKSLAKGLLAIIVLQVFVYALISTGINSICGTDLSFQLESQMEKALCFICIFIAIFMFIIIDMCYHILICKTISFSEYLRYLLIAPRQGRVEEREE